MGKKTLAFLVILFSACGVKTPPLAPLPTNPVDVEPRAEPAPSPSPSSSPAPSPSPVPVPAGKQKKQKKSQ